MTMLRLTENMRVKTTRGGRLGESNRVVLTVTAQHNNHSDVCLMSLYCQQMKTVAHKTIWQYVRAYSEKYPGVSPEMAADILAGLCDAFAALNNVPYHIENPERLETLRAGRWTKMPRREREGV